MPCKFQAPMHSAIDILKKNLRKHDGALTSTDIMNKMRNKMNKETRCYVNKTRIRGPGSAASKRNSLADSPDAATASQHGVAIRIATPFWAVISESAVIRTNDCQFMHCILIDRTRGHARRNPLGWPDQTTLTRMAHRPPRRCITAGGLASGIAMWHFH